MLLFLSHHVRHTALGETLTQQLRLISTTAAPLGDAAAAAAAAAPSGHDAVSALQQPLLYRDFIQHSLYHPELGYFNRPSPPLRRLRQPLNFNRLLNQAEYRLQLARAYQELQVDWLTPVEVFAPWYGRAIAHYILEVRAHSGSGSGGPLAIVEVGGGTGTLAASVLDYVSEKDPITYSNMSYTTIEISASLAALQQQYIAKERGHGRPWRLVPGDASQPGTWQQVGSSLPKPHTLQQQHCFVLMMEVLDNLPHDRVVRQDTSSPWQQVAVAAAAGAAAQQQHADVSSARHQPPFVEVLQPLTDPLMQRCLAALHPPSSTANEGSDNRSSSGGGGDSGGSSGFSSSSSSSSSSNSSRALAWLQGALGLQPLPGDACDVWLPTRCLQLLDVLHAHAPHHTLLAADFDALPDVVVPGRGAPLVSGRAAPGVTRDYGSVLVPWGVADIFFPTDFEALGRLYAAAAAAAAAAAEGAADRGPREGVAARRRVSSSHSSTADFMEAFAEARHTRTLSGYNPLVQDWLNTRIFVGQAAPAGSAAASAESAAAGSSSGRLL